MKTTYTILVLQVTQIFLLIVAIVDGFQNGFGTEKNLILWIGELTLWGIWHILEELSTKTKENEK